MSNMLLHEEAKQRLICSSCGFLISFGPVTRSSKGYQCGRCPNENGEQCIIYETLAVHFVFPCKYKSSGCEVVLPFGHEMEYHELYCKKALYKCPVALGRNCDWEGMFDEIEDHFDDDHSAIVLRDLSLNVNLEEEADVTYVYFYNDTVFFLIDFWFDKDKGLVMDLMRVLKGENEEVPIGEKYDIVLNHTYGKLYFSQNMSKYYLNRNCAKIANNDAIDIAHFNYIATIDKKRVINIHLNLSQRTHAACRNAMYGCKYMDYF